MKNQSEKTSRQEKKAKKDVKALEKKLQKLQEQLESVQKEKDQTFEKLQRVSADYVNYQKRMPKQIADSVAYEKEKIVKALLGAIDNFELALSNSQKADSLDTFVQGIEIVHNEIINTFKNLGIEQIVCVGEKFDPAKHEALMQQSQQDAEDGQILQEFQKGYTLNDKVIRPAKVIVNKIQPVADDNADSQDNSAQETTDENQEQQ